jgi:hypothetical protein
MFGARSNSGKELFFVCLFVFDFLKEITELQNGAWCGGQSPGTLAQTSLSLYLCFAPTVGA